MNPYKSLFWLAATVLCLPSLQAQTLKRLTIGDPVPDVALQRFLQRPLPEKSITGLKGKLVLLDFWDVHCGVCIKAMPDMVRLQEKFGSALQIILITIDSRTAVEALFAKLRRPLPGLPMITDDKRFVRLFPYRTVPHHVWINKDGVVQYITNSWNATEENIESFLAGGKPKLEEKNEAMDFDMAEPLLKEGKGRLLKNLTTYTCFMNRVRERGGAYSKWQVDSNGKKTGLTLYNQTLLALFQIAYSETVAPGKKFGSRGTVVLDVKNPERFFPPGPPGSLDQWLSDNLVCYEASGPDWKESDFFKILQQDLKRSFPYEVSVEEKDLDCLALTGDNLDSALHTKSGVSSRQFGRDSFLLQNRPLKDFVQTLNYANLDAPYFFVDETNYPYNVDLRVGAELNNFAALSKDLARYGLKIEKRKHRLTVLVVRDKVKNQ